MNQQNSQPQKLEDKLRFNHWQYKFLKLCSKKGDEGIRRWNQWRLQNPEKEILLEEADLSGCYLKSILLSTNVTGGKSPFSRSVHLERSQLWEANLCGASLRGANLEETCLQRSHLERVTLENAHLENADLSESNMTGAFLKGAHLENATFFRAHLEDSQFQHAKAQGASFNSTHLKNAKLSVAHFEYCNFAHAFLENTDLLSSFLIGANFNKAKMRGCWVRCSVVDGASKFWECQTINRYSRHKRFTDFSGTALDNVIIDPGTKQLLEYNIRRMNWEDWYPKQHSLLAWLVRKFWQISDYGISTKEIIKTFFKWAFVFAIVYYAWGCVDYYLLSNKDYPGIVSNLFVLEDSKQAVSGWLVPLRAFYFSIVTMTTLGFGDMYANANSLFRGIFGHILLAFQVILGYVLLGALVTRFAVLFTAGGPAGKFADDNKIKNKNEKSKTTK